MTQFPSLIFLFVATASYSSIQGMAFVTRGFGTLSKSGFPFQAFSAFNGKAGTFSQSAVRRFSQSTEEEINDKIYEHQKNAVRLSKPVEARTLLEQSIGFGVMSTISKDFGYPAGSIVGFALDKGLPFFVFSGMSQHTQDILVDPRFSLTVTSKDFKTGQDGRVSLTGNVEKVPAEEVDALRGLYLKKHPNAFWVNFGDFNFFRTKDLADVKFVSGCEFTEDQPCTPEDYLQAEADPVAAYASNVIGHMNDDHADSTAAMVKHYITGCDVKDAKIVALDSLGMVVTATVMGEPAMLRLPFVRKVEDRKDLKDIIVEMTKASAEA